MRIKIFSALFVLLLLFTCNFTTTIAVQAQTLSVTIPSFGLYSDEGTIQSGSVTYDLTGGDLFKQGKAMSENEYVISGSGKAEFYIPFIASAVDLPNISVTADNVPIEYEILYGEPYNNQSFDKSKLYSTQIAESEVGTLYTVYSAADSLTVSIQRDDSQIVLYEPTNSTSLYYSANEISITLNNAKDENFTFFVSGECEEDSFSSTCEYEKENITCQNFIDRFYEEYKVLYEQENILPFLYARMNRLLSNHISCTLTDLFINSITKQQINAFCFTLSLADKTIIGYNLPTSINADGSFYPTIYAFKHNSTAYPVTYTVKPNEGIPYLIDSLCEMQEQGEIFISTESTTNGAYFIFCSVTNPTQNSNSDNRLDIVGIVLIVLIILLCATLVVLIIFIVQYIRKR